MRELYRSGVCWTVREASAARTPGAQADRCLIFDSDGIVRRLWTFPSNWRELDDAEIFALLDAPQTPALGIQTVRDAGNHPVVAAAAAAQARARSLVSEASVLRDSSRLLGEERRRLLESCRIGRDEMRTAISEYVTMLRREGVPPERAVALLKSAIEDGLALPAGSPDSPGSNAVVGDAIRWGIEAYYAA